MDLVTWIRRLVFGDQRPAAEKSRREQRIVRITTARNEPMALLTKQVLEAEGIGVLLKPIGVGYGGWGNANNLMHDVYVLEGDEERAREVLETVADGQNLVLPGDG